MSKNNINPSLFLDDEFEEVKLTPEKVVCLGMEFENDDARRAYFREELRKKLPELKQIEGFPIGEDDDIINLSDPPYYTACPNPWLNDFIAEWEQEKVQLETDGKRKKNFEVKVPYTSDVSEGKFDPLYMHHPYLTKVPHKAIQKYLEYYTEQGDVILDGFAGTGMTGAASRLCNKSRNAICLDLSPLATFISYCINSDVSGQTFQRETAQIIERVKEELGWMFYTKHTNGDIAEINYVLWSNSYLCNNCSSELIFWDAAVNKKEGKILDTFICSNCGTKLRKTELEKVNEIRFDNISHTNLNETKKTPVLINYSYNGKRYEKRPDRFDLETVNKILSLESNDWIPLDKTYIGDELSRCFRDGIEYFYQYYTRRTLLILSKVKSLVRNKPILNYLITKLAFQSTIMYRYTYMNGCWGAGGGPMSGTLYVPSLFKELNIFSQLESLVTARNKIPVSTNMNNVVISTQSILDVSLLREGSIDYIFTDPPFGKNFMYSEMNRISEMWLRVHTNSCDECIISTSQQKDFLSYQNLMQGAFTQYFRVLKPGKWMSVEFSNTSAMVWTCIQNSIQNAGFVIANVSALDKKKESFKAVTTTTAVKQDLVITCYKPTEELLFKFETAVDKASNAMDFIEELLVHLPVHLEKDNSTTAVIERSPKILYDRLISYYVQHGYAIPMDAQEFQRGLRERFIERDGMFFTASQALEYEEKKKATNGIIPMALFISSEAEGIEWLKRELETPQTYQELHPEWMKAMSTTKKGDVLPELMTILEENFIKDEDGKWRKPDPEKAADLEIIRNRKMMKEFNMYLEQAQKPKAKRMKDTRLEVLRYGFKECYKQKDYKSIILVGDHIQESLLQEDEVLLQYYDIASTRV
ncbi:MAG: DNA methyltransferase [Parabacteroides sp.]|nr:DNA methyltransferase [Parabacteroides sp.]